MNENFYFYESGSDLEYYDEDLGPNQILSQRNILDVCKYCIFPIITSTLFIIFNVFFWALVYRIISKIEGIPYWISHVASFSTGVLSVYFNNKSLSRHILYLGVVTYLLITILSNRNVKCSGYIVAGLSCSYLCFGEFYLEENDWREIRGIQMIIVMKSVSIAFDIDKSTITIPNICEYFGYLYSVSNILFGPWISYMEYLNVLQKPSITTLYKNVWQIGSSLGLSLFFLTISNCWGYYFFADDSPKWLLIYRDALLFRSSHYFISYLSMSVMMTSGYPYLQVVDVKAIEVPFSLVQVVVNWNIPMHRWLKYYIFRPCQKMGKFWAVLCVYVASAALHGFSVALALVLLSLGFYTYVEYMLRHKLSLSLNACILANQCRENCTHLYKRNHPFSIIVNIIFVVISIIHLAYLGVIFEQISLMHTQDILTHTINTWAEVNFLSHLIVLVMYFFYIVQ